jgi:hypothetical protein
LVGIVVVIVAATMSGDDDIAPPPEPAPEPAPEPLALAPEPALQPNPACKSGECPKGQHYDSAACDVCIQNVCTCDNGAEATGVDCVGPGPPGAVQRP